MNYHQCKIIVAVPVEIPVTNPVGETVAIVGELETQGLIRLGVPTTVNCLELFKQIEAIWDVIVPETVTPSKPHVPHDVAESVYEKVPVSIGVPEIV